MVPIGDYDVIVARAESAKTGTDKDVIKVVFKVLNGPNANDTIPNNFVISPESAPALAFFFRHMGVLGLTKDYFKSKPTMAQVATALVGKTARVSVTHREWNGQTQLNVASIKAIPGGATAAPVIAPAGGIPTPGMVPLTPSVPMPEPVAMPAPVEASTTAAPPLPF